MAYGQSKEPLLRYNATSCRQCNHAYSKSLWTKLVMPSLLLYLSQRSGNTETFPRQPHRSVLEIGVRIEIPQGAGRRKYETCRLRY